MKNQSPKAFSLKDRVRSFHYAFAGLRTLLAEEHNARIHCFIAIGVVVAGFFFGISTTEWLVICLLIGLVFGLEIVNSAIENICNYVSPQKNDVIKKTKDMMAAAVLIAALVAIVCGCIIFIPKIYILVNQHLL